MASVALPHGKPGEAFWNGAMGDPQFPSFGQLFALHCSLEEAISEAARDGAEICPSEIIAKLLSGSAPPAISAAELHEALVHAAAQAGVRVRLN